MAPKRSRTGKTAALDDTARDDADDVMADARASSSSDSDDDDDELTFAEQAQDDDDESDDDDQDEDDEMDGAHADGLAGSRVQVEFVFSDPLEAHFHSVKQFLLSFLPSTEPLDISGLASLIVAQVTAGTMICVDGEDDVYAFLTALSLQRYQQETCMQQVVKYVTKHCPMDLQPRLQQVLQTRKVALLVNERMVNLPYQLVPALHTALHEDIAWAIEHEETAELRASFEFEYFLVLATCTMDAAAGAATSSSQSKKKAKTTAAPAAAARFFANFEDEFLEPEAELVYTFETPRSERDPHHRVSIVMLIPRARHQAALANLAAMLNA